MSDINQQIADIEEEIRKTPYHKGTEHHIGKLRARLARLKDRLIEGEIKSKRGGEGGGYAVKKQGDATVVLIGPPSSGKSTLINQITNVESKVAPYAFTTVSVIPGMLKYNDAYIQILDVPGLIEGAGLGKGRGKEVLSVARAADLLVLMTDVDQQNFFGILSTELEKSGIRINQLKPNVKIDKKNSGGLIIHSNIKQELDKETMAAVANEFGIRNAEITLKEKLTLDGLIDSFSSSRIYIPAIFIVNKIDKLPNFKEKKFDKEVILISAEKNIGLDKFKEAVWQALNLVKIYLVGPNDRPNYNNPIIMKLSDTLKDVAVKIGPDFSESKKLAKIWGEGAYFPGQEVALTTKVQAGMQVRFL